MAIELPESANELEQRSKTDVQRELGDGSNPFLKNSLSGALVTGYSNRIYDFYGQLDLLQSLLLPDQAEGDFADRWAAIYGKQRLAATKSTGDLIATGNDMASIPSGTLFSSSNGEIYESTSSVLINETIISIVSLTRSGTTVTAVTATNHNLANNVKPEIKGAIETEYNGVQDIIVVDETTFTYEISTTPTTPATGTITATYLSAVVPVESQDFQNSEEGKNVNLDSGEFVSLQSSLVGVDNDLAVGAVPIGGGTDQESDTLLRNRTLDRIQNPVSHFNVSDIKEKAKEIAGVTRVFVQEVTPAVGQVTIYFMRDNDDDPIPDSGEVSTVKDKILEIKPANTSDSDVIVSAPTANSTDFIFTALSPNSSSMQAAITENLNQFFAEETEVGVDIQEDAYRAAIQNTIDTETGERVQSFTLSTPSGNIIIASSEIGVLGTVTYP